MMRSVRRMEAPDVVMTKEVILTDYVDRMSRSVLTTAPSSNLARKVHLRMNDTHMSRERIIT
jgi:hypothetical protein